MTELEKAANRISILYEKILDNQDWDISELDELLDLSRKDGIEWQAKQSRWKIVADEEPPEYKDVLLSAGSRPDIFVGYFNGEHFRCRSTGEEIEYFRVLHWMEIPE